MLVRVNNRVVGKIDKDIFKKKLSASKHFLRKPHAIAFDVTSINNAQILGAKTIEVTDKDTGDKYTTSISKIHLQGFKFDRGYGFQIGLIIDEWDIHKDTERKLKKLKNLKEIRN